MALNDGRTYEADISWTTHGVAHIHASTWGDLGFGQGYACARDNLATIADQIVKVRGERARFFGRGTDDNHIASDFGYRALDLPGRAVILRDSQPAYVAEAVEGYAVGYTTWLREARAVGAIPDDAEWIRPISTLDLFAYLADVALLASGRNLVGLIGRAEAPGPDGPVPPSPMSALRAAEGASNGWAMGRDATKSGHGMVLANPHFPWYGEARFWECHLTIPDEIDAYGVSLLGCPGIAMGFNPDIAWAHTFSAGHRFVLYKLELDPTSPTSYRYGDDTKTMTSRTYSVDVRNDDGSVETIQRELWDTHYGPMVNLPLVGWGTDLAFCMKDANLDNTTLFAQFFGMACSRGMDEFQDVFATTKGMPWANTLAADRTGRTWYIDASATPNISAAAQQRVRDRLSSDPIAMLLAQARIALLDGAEPDDEWIDEPGARSPGLVPFDRLPQIERPDYVANANDSHWLANPAAPLTGYSVLHGFEDAPQTLRTRRNHIAATALIERGDVTTEDLLDAVFDNLSESAVLLRDAMVERWQGAVESNPELAASVEILREWDCTYRLDSVGAVLWREVMAIFPESDRLNAGPLFATPFDPANPVHTPTSLAPAPDGRPDPVVTALSAAVETLGRAGVALDAPLGTVQWAVRGGERIAVHGGGGVEGLMNVLAPQEAIGGLPRASLDPIPRPPEPIGGRTELSGLRMGGYQVDYGTSFLMAVELTDDGPVARGLLAYGQSGDPHSEHHVDGTIAYRDCATRPLLFTPDDIAADPNLVRLTLRSDL